MRRCSALLVALLVWASGWATVSAGVFKLEDGTTIRGEVATVDDYGVNFKLDTGGFSERVSWGKFTQETLKELAEDQRARPMAEPFIEVPPEAKPKPKPIVLKEVPRVDRPTGRTTLFSSFGTSLGLAVLGLLYLSNLFAGYEIAKYRNRPVAVVCGLSALLPVLGPLIFLASPTVVVHAEAAAPAVPDPAAAPAVPAAGSPAAATSRRVGTPQTPAGGGLRVASEAAGSAAGGHGEPKVYNRGDYMFNRRFIETQFPGFFRVVPTEAEKDLVIVVKTPKAEYLGKRISRISANEMFLQLLQANKEVSITFGEIAQIVVRQKDDQTK